MPLYGRRVILDCDGVLVDFIQTGVTGCTGGRHCATARVCSLSTPLSCIKLLARSVLEAARRRASRGRRRRAAPLQSFVAIWRRDADWPGCRRRFCASPTFLSCSYLSVREMGQMQTRALLPPRVRLGPQGAFKVAKSRSPAQAESQRANCALE